MSKPLNVPVGRLAPSPTGLLHVGHARTFLLAWWFTRSRGGRVQLRIEDLDSGRCRPEFSEQAVRDLAWLGLDWDGPPILQSSGVRELAGQVQRLLDAGLAYPCSCSRSDILNAQSAPQQGAHEPRYPGTCRGRYASVAEAERVSGSAPGVRLRVPDGPIAFIDGLYGSQAFDVQKEAGDFLIARRDGAPAYQLAVVVDDALQGVTEVVRGSDLLPSTARQLWIQRALRLETPDWLHVPLVVDQSGRRLAKRAKDLGLSELRQRGVDARSIVGWVARSVGIPVENRLSARDVLPLFHASTLTREPVPLLAAELDAWLSR